MKKPKDVRIAYRGENDEMLLKQFDDKVTFMMAQLGYGRSGSGYDFTKKERDIGFTLLESPNIETGQIAQERDTGTGE